MYFILNLIMIGESMNEQVCFFLIHLQNSEQKNSMKLKRKPHDRGRIPRDLGRF